MPYKQPDNDKISQLLADTDMIPKNLEGNDKFIDVVTWNIKYFNNKSPQRVELITNILAELNADIIVFQEIYEGALDPVCNKLAERNAGYYHVEYGKTGGQQRVAIMWDLDWIRAKDEITELAGSEQVKVRVNGKMKKAFPRGPLHGYYTGIRRDTDNFDFHLIGLHLKSKLGGGGEQRTAAAQWLSDWIKTGAIDEDIIITGDWNDTTDSDNWQAIRELEASEDVTFSAINDTTEVSHLYYKNRNNIGSKIDLVMLSDDSEENMAKAPETIHWKNLTKAIETYRPGQLKSYIGELKNTISDHMPVISRFYWTDSDN